VLMTGALTILLWGGIWKPPHIHTPSRKRVDKYLKNAELTSRRRVGSGFVSIFPTDLVCTLNVFLHFALLPYQCVRHAGSARLDTFAAFQPLDL
jgi:hypothetical protein